MNVGTYLGPGHLHPLVYVEIVMIGSGGDCSRAQLRIWLRRMAVLLAWGDSFLEEWARARAMIKVGEVRRRETRWGPKPSADVVVWPICRKIL